MAYGGVKIYQMSKAIAERYRYSYILLRQLVVSDFKLRYQGSALGYLWSVMRPLALFGILYFVFGVAFQVGDAIPNFPVYLLIGIVVWNYFIEVTIGSVSAIVSRGDLLRKINFPKYVIILAGSFSALINLLINAAVITGFILFSDIDIGLNILLLPLIVLELFIFSLSVGFLLSALFVKFRDINYIWEVVVQGMFYATPILYPLSYVYEHASLGLAKIMMLNPVAQIIQDIRFIITGPSAETIGSIYGNSAARLMPIGFVLGLGIISALYFRAKSKSFAEDV